MKRAWAAAACLAAAALGCRTPVPFTSYERFERRIRPVQAMPAESTISIDGKELGNGSVDVEFSTRIRGRREWATPVDPLLAIPWSIVATVDYLIAQGRNPSFQSLDWLARGKPVEHREPIPREVEVRCQGFLTEHRRISADHESRAFQFLLTRGTESEGLSKPPTAPGDPTDSPR